MEQYYVQPNGELKFNRNKFHYPVEGFMAAKNAHQFDEPSWIHVDDIKPYIDPNWTLNYNPFSGARLIGNKDR